MKEKLLIFLSVMMSFCSCSKEAEDILVSKKGKWNYKSEYKYYMNSELVDEGVINGVYTFNDDNTYVYISDRGSGTGTWKITGDIITLYIYDNSDSASHRILESSRKSQKWELKFQHDRIGLDAITQLERTK